MEYLIKNNNGVFFIGLFITFGDTIFGEYKLIFRIIGFSLMIFSFYLMYLHSKQKK